MPMQMLGRPIVNKQVRWLRFVQSCTFANYLAQTIYGFYRPAAIVLANLLADLPFSAARVLIFDIIVYFMPKLYVMKISSFRCRATDLFFTEHVLLGVSGRSTCLFTLHTS